MARMNFRSGNRLAPRLTLRPMARPLGRLVGESGLFEPAVRRVPAVDVEERADELVLTADLPGFDAEAIEVALEDDVLTLRGEIEEPGDADDRRYHVRERRLGRFQRSFTLPVAVSADGITATLDNGVLRVRMPKAPESIGRTIRIGKPS